MEVDFFTGRNRSNKYGVDKYASNIISSLNKLKVDGKTISYPLKYHPPLSRLFFVPIYYSTIASIKKRKNSIKHITTQEHAHLLNFIDLKPSIVTCHDIIPILLSEYPYFLRKNIKFCLKGMMKADKIIADSEHTKHDIINHLGYPKNNIHVISLGVDLAKYKPLKIKNNFFKKFGLSSRDRIILCVGSLEPRKNFDGLLKAFYKLKKRYSNAKLIRVGGGSWGNTQSKTMKMIKDLDLQKDVFSPGYISEDLDLINFYNLADLLVFPSYYEGFGLPPLEAMACGTPTITSNITSLPEVVGDAGIMVDPHNVDDLTNAMYNVLTNDVLKEEMIKKGLERAKIFDCNVLAMKTLNVYKEVINSN